MAVKKRRRGKRWPRKENRRMRMQRERDAQRAAQTEQPERIDHDGQTSIAGDVVGGGGA